MTWWESLKWWEWVLGGVWFFFTAVAASMIPEKEKRPFLVNVAFFLLMVILLLPLGPFAFAMALDAES